METNNLFEKVLKDNEFIKGQLNNLQESIQILKNNMIESQNNKNNINFSSLLDDLNISSSKEEINPNDINNNPDNENNNNNILHNIIQEQKEQNKINNKCLISKESKFVNNKNVKNTFDDNIHKRNIKKLLKEKEVINQIYLLKENFNNYNNYNIYNKSCQENSSKKNSTYFQGLSASNKKSKNNNKIIFNNNCQKSSNKKIIFFKEDDITSKNVKNIKNNKINNNKILNSAKKEKRTNSVINIKMKSNQKNKNKNKNNVNKPNNLRYSFDDYYHRNESYIENKKNNKNNGINKRVEILNYLKEINSLQNIISQLKKENLYLKNTLEKEKQKNKKFRKITEEIIKHFEKPNNNF